MKIASVNPMLYDFGVDLDAYMVKPEVQNQVDIHKIYTTINHYVEEKHRSLCMYTCIQVVI